MLSPKKHVSNLQIAQVAGIMDEADVAALKQAALPKDFHDPYLRVRILEVNGSLAHRQKCWEIAEEIPSESSAWSLPVAREVVDLERILLHGTSNVDSALGSMAEAPSFWTQVPWGLRCSFISKPEAGTKV